MDGGLGDDHGRLLDRGLGLPLLVEVAEVATGVAALDGAIVGPLGEFGGFSDDGDGFASSDDLGEGLVPLVHKTSGAPAHGTEVGTAAVVLDVHDGPCNGCNGRRNHGASN